MTGNADHERIWAEWHRAASTSDQAALIALYADDAILESPLVPAILDDMPEGILHGRRQSSVSWMRAHAGAPIRWCAGIARMSGSAKGTPSFGSTPDKRTRVTRLISLRSWRFERAKSNITGSIGAGRGVR